MHISQMSALSPKLAVAGYAVTVATKNLEDWPHTVHTVVVEDAWSPATAMLARLVFLSLPTRAVGLCNLQLFLCAHLLFGSNSRSGWRAESIAVEDRAHWSCKNK